MSRDSEHPLKAHLNLFGPALIVTLLGFLLAYQFVDPAPPDHIRIASGNKDGAYYLFARQYREYLAREGIELEVVTSAGSLENIQLLESGRVDLAFVQGGLADKATQGNLVSLGSFYYEPLWMFHRGELEINTLTGLKQRRVAVGAERSGTRALALQLLGDNNLHAADVRMLSIDGHEAAEALLAGEIDAAFFVASPKSPVVRSLLESESLKLMSFGRADAYTRLHPYLSSVLLPEGVVNMERNLPGSETRLLSATANLVATDRLHPALVELLVYVGGRIHGAGGWFEARGEFPSPAYTDFPLSADAARFYERGPSFLQRYL
ncbi:MAG TPA: TAXI family TRAP transporter solute-binding subunit, partial [Gammaproteobacteria bacterium]|nr:TAXI family TRAP transporter solute-binding subunit [Gammaproteobacteria bacterium]